MSDLRTIAERAYDALNAGDLKAFIAIADPDVEFRSLIAESEGVVYRGHAGIREWWGEVVEPMSPHFELLSLDDRGDRGVAELVLSGTLRGATVSQRTWQAVRLRADQAVWWQSFRTREEALASLGLS